MARYDSGFEMRIYTVRSEHGLQKTKCVNGVHGQCEIIVKIQLTENVLILDAKRLPKTSTYSMIYYVAIKKFTLLSNIIAQFLSS